MATSFVTSTLTNWIVRLSDILVSNEGVISSNPSLNSIPSALSSSLSASSISFTVSSAVFITIVLLPTTISISTALLMLIISFDEIFSSKAGCTLSLGAISISFSASMSLTVPLYVINVSSFPSTIIVMFFLIHASVTINVTNTTPTVPVIIFALGLLVKLFLKFFFHFSTIYI